MPLTITGVSIDSEVLKKAKAIAKGNRRSFSNYVEGLLLRDQNTIQEVSKIKKETERIKKDVVKLRRK